MNDKVSIKISNFSKIIRKLNSEDKDERMITIKQFRSDGEGMLMNLLTELEKRSYFDEPLWKKCIYIFIIGPRVFNRLDQNRDRQDYNWRFRQSALLIFRAFPGFVKSNKKRIAKFKSDLNYTVKETAVKTLASTSNAEDVIKLND